MGRYDRRDDLLGLSTEERKKVFIKEYSEKNKKGFNISLNKKYDPLMIAYLQSLPNKQQYLKGLIRADMERQGIPCDEENPPEKEH